MLFLFNLVYGVCEICCGFGCVIGVDFGFVIFDVCKMLCGGVIKLM